MPFQFLSSINATPATEISGSYNPFLVILSVIIATIAAYTALTIADYLLEDRSDATPPRRLNWLISGAVAMGCGIWCMHFIGMLAFQLPVPVHYDTFITLVSMVPAILASGIALHVISQPRITFGRAHISGLLMGIGIGTMHYTGMAAMVMNAQMAYDPLTFVLSLVVAYVLATASLYAKFRLQFSDALTQRVRQIGASLFLGCAVAGMHYTGMAAAHYYPVERSAMPNGIDSTVLAFTVLSGTLLLLGVTIATVYLHRRLQQAAVTIENLMENAPDALVTVDREGLISLVNRQTEITFGYDRSELLGNPIEVLVPHGQRQIHAIHRDNYAKTPAVRNMGVDLDLYARRKDGTEFPVEISLSYERTGNGIFVTSLIRDMTLRRQAESEKHLLEQQLQQSQKMEAVGRLAGGVAHDFNNILTGIGGYAEMLRDNIDGSTETIEDIEEIQKLVTRGTTLTRQLLVFSSKNRQVEPEIINLNDVLKDMARMIRTLVHEHVECHVTTHKDLGFVEATTGQIEQLVMNLVINASDAIPDSGTITITTDNVTLTETDAEPLQLTPGAYCALTIADSGTGMTEEVQRRVFEPFFTTKKAGEGTGLGLAVVFGIVEQYGGAINIDSAPGSGTIFTIYFPQTRASQREAQPSDKTTASGGHETILLVEDEASVRSLVHRSLSAKGYTVLSAANGREGLKILKDRDGNVDLILTDLVMPKMSGKQLADESLQLYPGLKVLFISGYDHDQDTSVSNIPLVEKPFQINNLLTQLRAVLDA